MNEIPGIVNSVQNHWQFMALCVIAFTAILYFYMKYLKKESDSLLHKAQELEEARTLLRKADRDKQIASLEGFAKSEFASVRQHVELLDSKVEGLGRGYDRHCEESEKRFEKIDAVYERIDGRLKKMEESNIKEKEFKDVQADVQETKITIACMNSKIDSMAESNKRVETMVAAMTKYKPVSTIKEN